MRRGATADRMPRSLPLTDPAFQNLSLSMDASSIRMIAVVTEPKKVVSAAPARIRLSGFAPPPPIADTVNTMAEPRAAPMSAAHM